MMEPILSLLGSDLHIYMSCPHCLHSKKKDTPEIKFASSVLQLQRIFWLHLLFPVILAANIIQFEASCLPVDERENKLLFTLGCGVILPPESFLVLRLPFVYGVQVNDQEVLSLNPFEHQPNSDTLNQCHQGISSLTSLTGTSFLGFEGLGVSFLAISFTANFAFSFGWA